MQTENFLLLHKKNNHFITNHLKGFIVNCYNNSSFCHQGLQLTDCWLLALHSKRLTSLKAFLSGEEWWGRNGEKKKSPWWTSYMKSWMRQVHHTVWVNLKPPTCHCCAILSYGKPLQHCSWPNCNWILQHFLKLYQRTVIYTFFWRCWVTTIYTKTRKNHPHATISFPVFLAYFSSHNSSSRHRVLLLALSAERVWLDG